MENNQLTADFNRWVEDWTNTKEVNDKIYYEFQNKTLQLDFLKAHVEYINKNSMGFGEIPFRYMWLLLMNELPDNFKFLEIGVYKGSVLALVQLCANQLNKKGTIYGVTPLSQAGDKYLPVYDNADYLNCIGSVYKNLNLNIDNTIIINGLSTNPEIKATVKEESPFDMIYIDGSHDYKDVVSDILLCDELLKPNGLLVMDDASSDLALGIAAQFHGHADVAAAIRDTLDTTKYTHLFACGHNRVWKKN